MRDFFFFKSVLMLSDRSGRGRDDGTRVERFESGQ